ncbi:hypothetical protein ACFV0C_12585 [Streptomyces sp. NPDC059568]|uniref:hypothetical protein n=1 Tax=Streptomyces sp. NPDC059568 TaxID=3346868 RepID=UPI0036C9670A
MGEDQTSVGWASRSDGGRGRFVGSGADADRFRGVDLVSLVGDVFVTASLSGNG